MFTQADHDWYTLSIIGHVHDINAEYAMPDRAMRKARRLHLKVLLQGVNFTLDYAPNGHEVITVGEQRFEISPAASDDEIRARIANPFIPTENIQMSITGLQSGAFQSKLAEMRQKIAEKQAQALAKIDGTVTDGLARIEAAAAGATAKATKEIEDALQEFAEHTNGGPV